MRNKQGFSALLKDTLTVDGDRIQICEMYLASIRACLANLDFFWGACVSVGGVIQLNGKLLV